MILRLLQLMVMIAWAVFFVWLFAVDQPTLARLLHPRLWWLVVSGAIVLTFFFGVSLPRLTAPHPVSGLRWRWPTYLVLLVPLCYVGLMRSARFDSQTFRDRSAPIDISAPAQAVLPDHPGSADDSTPVEAPFSRIVLDPQQYAGRKVEVLCQTFNDQRLPDNNLICYRFRITCCAADALPIFVLVAQQPGHPVPDNDAWMRVQGILSVHQTNGLSLPFIQASSMAAEKEPSFPFVF